VDQKGVMSLQECHIRHSLTKEGKRAGGVRKKEEKELTERSAHQETDKKTNQNS